MFSQNTLNFRKHRGVHKISFNLSISNIFSTFSVVCFDNTNFLKKRREMQEGIENIKYVISKKEDTQ